MTAMDFYCRLAERLVGVGIVDITPHALSSVYFYFEPALARRSLGVFSALREIEECRRRELSYWYVGFYVQGCAKMEYKGRFQPHELLSADGKWQPALTGDGCFGISRCSGWERTNRRWTGAKSNVRPPGRQRQRRPLLSEPALE